MQQPTYISKHWRPYAATGHPPVFDHFSTPAEHGAAIVRPARRPAANDGTALGDIAVLCDTNHQIARVIKMLEASRLPTIDRRA